MIEFDKLLEAAKWSASQIILYKHNTCYYGCVKPDLYISNYEHDFRGYLHAYCEKCASINMHLNLEKLEAKEIFTIQTFTEYWN